ncbi:YesL family protein [Ruminococcaceae bacterium OttesenSCG-928-D13]|nr:YesL family protein [Ruminococcaceae bacterium OttesenSCG-928-D13]
MALFKRDFNKPGPGVPKNAPRKRGFARFGELMVRDFGNLVKLNLIYQLCILLPQALLLLSLIGIGTAWFLIFGVLALIACIPLGPAKTAMTYMITKMLRDDPGFIWHDFRRLFKENFKSSVIPGLVYGLVVGAQAFSFVFFSGGETSMWMLALLLFSIIVFHMAAPYYFLQTGYLELKSGGLLKNSLLLALGNAPRSFVGAILGAGLVAAQMLLFPMLIPISLVFGYTIPTLLNMMWIWPKVDSTFKIEKTLRQRASGETDEADEEAEETDSQMTETEDED